MMMMMTAPLTTNTILPGELNVLIVEDEPRYRAFLTETLRDMQCAAVGAASAREAHAAMEASPPDVLILDLNLPVVDGMTFLEQFRAMHPVAPVIIITGFGDLQSAQRAIHLGVTEFLTKPCHLGDIERAIDRARKQIALRRESGPREHLAHAARDEDGDPRSLAVIEREAILDTLRACGGNRTAAAGRLGISRRALYNKIELYRRDGFDVP